jgi:hypothetical protein
MFEDTWHIKQATVWKGSFVFDDTSSMVPQFVL